MRRLVYIVFAIPIIVYLALVIYATKSQTGGSARSKCFSCEHQDPYRDYPQSCYACEYQERAMYDLMPGRRFSPSSQSPIYEITQGV